MHRQWRCGRATGDQGAAAVEFALVFPLLLLVIFGIIDFGRAFNAQVTLTEAAREGVRLASLGQPEAAVVSRTQSAATGLSPVSVTVTGCGPGSGPESNAVVGVKYVFSFDTPVGAIAGLFGDSRFGSSATLSAQGVMPCET